MPTIPRHRAGHRKRHTGARLAALGTLCLLAGGCGSRLVAVHSSVLRLRIDEYRITPQDVQVPAGRLKIIVFNTGIGPHDVRVQSTRPNADGKLVVFGGTSVILPGQQAVSCALPAVSGVPCTKLDLQPGTYRLFDTIANNADLGDYGTLTAVG